MPDYYYEDYNELHDDDDDGFDMFIVSMESAITEEPIGAPLLVYARNFDDAIDIYTLIYKISGGTA